MIRGLEAGGVRSDDRVERGGHLRSRGSMNDALVLGIRG